jgi:hypothetical protein
MDACDIKKISIKTIIQMGEDKEREIRDWIRKKVEEISAKQNITTSNKFEELKNEEKPKITTYEKNVSESEVKNKLIKYLKLLLILFLALDLTLLFLYFRQAASEPLLLKIYKNQYNYSTIKLKGTLVSFRISSATGKGMGYLEEGGYVIQIYNLTNINYKAGDVIETNSSITYGNTTVTLLNIEDKKVGSNKIIPKKRVKVEQVNKNPQKYEWMLIKLENAVVEDINITSILPPINHQEEHYLVELKIRNLNMTSFYLGPKLNVKVNETYAFLAAVLKSGDKYILRVFSVY